MTDLKLQFYADERDKGKLKGMDSIVLVGYIIAGEIKYTFENASYAEEEVQDMICGQQIMLISTNIKYKRKDAFKKINNGLINAQTKQRK